MTMFQDPILMKFAVKPLQKEPGPSVMNIFEIIPKELDPGARFISLVFITSNGEPTHVATNPDENALAIWRGFPSGIPMF